MKHQKLERQADLVFIEQGHIYEYRGEQIPSVTQLINRYGFTNTRWFKQEHADRGTFVHKASEYIEKGASPDLHKISPYYGYLKAYESFLRESGWKSLHMEFPFVHLRAGIPVYCGTIDRIGFFPDSSGIDIIDIKTGATTFSHGLQLAGYHHGVNGRLEKYPGRHILQLKKDGKYSLKDSFSGNDFDSDIYDNTWIDIMLAEYHGKQVREKAVAYA